MMIPDSAQLWACILFVLLTSPALAFVGECPQFSCSEPYSKENHGWYDGKFVDRGATWDEAHGEADGIVRYFYFDPNDFPDAYPDITGGALSNGQLACAQVCRQYNKDGGTPRAGYWMFEQTCTYGVGGQCSCMDNSTACAGPYWSDQALEQQEYGYNAKDPANYTTGKICGADGSGDPHFTGADGSHFDFSGEPNKAYALISDSHVQMNVFLGGRYGKWDKRIKALTWMRKISIMWGHHVAILAARPGADGDYKVGYLDSVIVDGEPIQVQPHATVTALGGGFSITWQGVKVRSGRDWVDEFLVEIPEVLTVRLIVRPEVRLLRTKSDAVIHFTLKVDSAKLSSNAHGILGQTFRPDFLGRLALQKLEYSKLLNTMVVPGDNAEGFIDGSVKDYQVKDLEKADCMYCRFARGTSVDDETSKAIAMSAFVTSMATARKLLTFGRVE